MSAAPGVSLDTLAKWLSDARAAYHALSIGRLSVEVAADGAIVKYTRANAPELLAYIARLEAQWTAVSSGRVQRPSAIGVVF
jgi:hypothetical protein